MYILTFMDPAVLLVITRLSFVVGTTFKSPAGSACLHYACAQRLHNLHTNNYMTTYKILIENHNFQNYTGLYGDLTTLKHTGFSR